MRKMIKKWIGVLLVLILVMSIPSACIKNPTEAFYSTDTEDASPESYPTPVPSQSSIEIICYGLPPLIIWSYTDELKAMTIEFQGVNYFEVDVSYVEIPIDGGEFRQKVIDAANTRDCPDIIVMDTAMVREFIEKDMLYDISDLKPYADVLQTYVNTIEVGTNHETGEIYAYSYQNSPGAVFYRRSLAKEYFGTDDPAEIQALMADMDKFTAMAATVKEKSGGKTFMVASVDEFRNAYLANRTDPWFVDDTLVIDPKVDELFETAKVFRENGYEARANQWSEGWYSGMSDSLSDAGGNAIQIFCYFLPTWGLPYVLAPNAGNATKGDWGCISGPLAYQWGGTWVGVMKHSGNPNVGEAFIRFVALDETNLTNWATGVYTHGYLQAINHEWAGRPREDELNQPAGDFVSSKKVVDAITANFDDSKMSEFLGGQNFYGAFAESAPLWNGKIIQSSDEIILDIFIDYLNRYASGELTKEEAMTGFEESVTREVTEKP